MANAAIQPDSLVHCLKVAKPRIVLADALTAATLSYHRAELTKAGVAEIFSWQDAKHLKHNGVSVLDFANLQVPARSAQDVIEGKGFDIEKQTPESDGVIFFTSGTTGYPKAVVSSQRAALHNVLSSIQRKSNCRAKERV
jgi:long-subunit acyl-CoA synthetase (AMP-forming)